MIEAEDDDAADDDDEAADDEDEDEVDSDWEPWLPKLIACVLIALLMRVMVVKGSKADCERADAFAEWLRACCRAAEADCERVVCLAVAFLMLEESWS
jgi:hypothetical protein